MKPSFISALLFLVSITSLRTTLGQVEDIDGDLLIPGRKYFVMPAIFGLSGGLTVSDRGSCKTDVIQGLNPADRGIPVSFHPFVSAPFVPESEDLNAEFSAEFIPCAGSSVGSSVWMMDQTSIGGYVTTGGVKGNPGPEALNSWFKIEKAEDGLGYKFMFCPTVCETCQSICSDLGISIDNGGNRHLALGQAVVNFEFLKASS